MLQSCVTFKQGCIVGKLDADDLQGCIAAHAIPAADAVSIHRLTAPALTWQCLLVPGKVWDGISKVQKPLLVWAVSCTHAGASNINACMLMAASIYKSLLGFEFNQALSKRRSCWEHEGSPTTLVSGCPTQNESLQLKKAASAGTSGCTNSPRLFRINKCMPDLKDRLAGSLAALAVYSPIWFPLRPAGAVAE